ncbi:MAG: helix-turn-helix domain-containing protein [Pseudomonadota bacterium]
MAGSAQKKTDYKDPQYTGLASLVQEALEGYFNAHDGAMPPVGLYDRVLNEIERPLISICLEYTDGNCLRAAELLGISRNTLSKKIKQLGLK